MSAAVAIAATGLQTYAKIRQMDSAASQAEQDANFYAEQAGASANIGARKLALLEREQGQFEGRQKSMFAKAGISFSGSVLDILADTQVQQAQERNAVQAETSYNIRLAQMKQKASQDTANAYRDPMNRFLEVGGTVLSGGSQAAAMAKK